MFLDRYINRFLTSLFGLCADKDSRVHFHSQNLNEDRQGKVRGWPYHGRCWLWVRNAEGRSAFQPHFSWHLWNKSFGARVALDSDHEDTVVFHIAIPPVSLWLTSDGPKWAQKLAEKLAPGEKYSYERKRELSFAVHNNSLWWNLWMNPDTWKSEDPKWRRGNINLEELLFGKSVYSERNVRTLDLGIPMPEGVYPVKLKMYEAVWKDRFRTRTLSKACIDSEIGIPFPGKGENSWDCGEDASYGLTTNAETPEQAVAAQVASVLRERRKHGGSVMMQYPSPEERRKKWEENRKKRENDPQPPPSVSC